ncbi:MAG: metalloregulator ArsR/SmtB family transcription factor [Actinomycetota bacterium]|nr:metalloregulator ArsR/SmtB family transcription factor [Actinomycetota bacterium]
MSPDETAPGGRAAKDALFEALVTVAKALANGRRAEIVELLAQGPRSVEEIAGEIDQSVANTSHHLRTLARSGLVSTRREGTRIIYSLADPQVFELWRITRAVATKQLDQIEAIAEAYLGDTGRLATVTRRELAERLDDDGGVVVIDVRPPAEHRAGHIPGSLSIPLDELDERLADLPEDVPIVAYCRGPYCVYADEAVRRLKQHGRDARRLEDGYPDWQRSGRPTEHS